MATSSRNVEENAPGDQGAPNLAFYPNCDATIWLRTCENEVTTPLPGIVKGIIPVWLNGTLVRNGPGRITVGQDTFNHLFDSSALLHRFHIEEGKVTYQNRFVRSRSFTKNMAAQRIVVNEFGTRAHPDPCKTIFSRFLSHFSKDDIFTDNTNITVFPWDGPDEVYALTETPFMQKIDISTLETLERVDVTKYVSVMTQSAHPHLMPDGTVYTLGQGLGLAGAKYAIVEFPPDSSSTQARHTGASKNLPQEATFQGSTRNETVRNEKKGSPKVKRARIAATHQARWRFNPSYMHSFSVTENYFAIIEQPLVVSMAKAAKVHMTQKALVDSLQWYDDSTYIHLICRETGKVSKIRYESDPLFFLHTINAYEDGDFVVLDLCTYQDAKMLDCMYVEALKTMNNDPEFAATFRGKPQRFVLPTKVPKAAPKTTNLVTLRGSRAEAYPARRDAVRVIPEPLCDLGCEVPRINYEKFNGRPYNYFYAIASDVDLERPGTLIKVNATAKTRITWSEDNVYPSEPIFIPAPHPRSEDDGVVLSVLLRAKGLDRLVTLLILDARSWKELGRVDFEADGPVPKDLHGWYFPAKKYA